MMKGKFLTETTGRLQHTGRESPDHLATNPVPHASRRRYRGLHDFSNSPSLPLGLQKSQDVVNLDGSLDISDNGSRAVVHEFDSDLGNTSSGTGTTEDLWTARNISVSMAQPLKRDAVQAARVFGQWRGVRGRATEAAVRSIRCFDSAIVVFVIRKGRSHPPFCIASLPE
jgi:hypothetical protein